MSNRTLEPLQIHGAHAASTVELVQTVLLICVKYGSDAETSRYLASLRRLHAQQSSLQVLVVDNTVVPGPAQPLTDSNVTLVRAKENFGYFGGARHGLSIFLQEHPMPDWVIVSNVDLVIEDSQFLNKLAALPPRPRMGVVAPSIRSALTGKDQNPFMLNRPPAWRMHAYKWMYRSWLTLNAYEVASAMIHKALSLVRRRTTAGLERNSGAQIYAPHGSFLIFSREYFRAGGSLDFPCFLFGEEVYLAESLRQCRLEAVYEPSLQIIHQEHTSTKRVKSRRLARAVAASAAYCADTYFPLR
jgi:GT2 family glycosyltransferase